jgi:hypothetical protein
MNNKLIGHLAIGTAVCFAACAHGPGGKDQPISMKNIGITGPTETPHVTPDLTGYVMVKPALNSGCVNATWRFDGGGSLPVGTQEFQFTVTGANKWVEVSAQNHQTTGFWVKVKDDVTLKYKIDCN